MTKDRRVLLYLAMLSLFALWLAAIVFWVFPHAVSNIKDLDPLMALIAGLGIGGITQFFIQVLILGWQFYYRKSGIILPPATPRPPG